MRIVAATNVITRSRLGLSLAEVMISLAISAMLLTAVAAAFSAPSEAIEQNDTFFRASQAARVSMTQLLTEIRRANAVSVPVGNSSLSMITFDNHDRTYSYDAAALKLKMTANDTAGKPSYTLASNCTSTTFDVDTMTDSGGIKHVIRVAVTIIVKVDKNAIRLTGSAAPRKEQTWQ